MNEGKKSRIIRDYYVIVKPDFEDAEFATAEWILQKLYEIGADIQDNYFLLRDRERKEVLIWVSEQFKKECRRI